MFVRRYQLSFTTPAFLGNAGQDAQWRTPPVKALLRQWWRIAWAAEREFAGSVEDMRREEGLLFGNAWLSHLEHGKLIHDHCQSRVRLRLLLSSDGAKSWAFGTQGGVSPLSTGLDTSYAWFGLIKRKGLPDRSGIKADGAESSRQLSIAAPETDWPQLEKALALMNAFGTLGSRSRGGWGSLHIDGAAHLSASEMKFYARPLAECLKNDWAMSLALTGGRLCVWHSKESFKTWSEAMTLVATERRHVRTTLGKDLRIALGFAESGRMPSPLRWKMVKTPEGRLQIRIAAMPHAIAADAKKQLSDVQLQSAWKTVIATLDGNKHFKRMEG